MRYIYILWYQRTTDDKWGFVGSYELEEHATKACEEMTLGCECRTFGVAKVALLGAVTVAP